MIFAPSAEERRTLRASTFLGALAVSAFGVKAALALDRGPVVLGVAVVLAVVLLVVGWTYHEGVTAVGPAGLLLRRPALPDRVLRWDEVASIDVRTARSRLLGEVRTLRVTRTDGRSFRLPPLEDSTYRPDPRFDAKCRRIVRCWEWHVGP